MNSVRIVTVLVLFIASITNNWNNEGYAQTTTLPASSLSPNLPPTIQITSHQDGQEVPAGTLTIEGISSDNDKTHCQVYADVNDNTPMRNVTASATSGDAEDFSRWTFTYTDQYQLIKEGANELTAKISCFGVNSPTGTPLSEWHTVNVTGVPNMAGESLVPPTSFSSPLLPEEDNQIEDSESEDDDNGNEDD